MYVNIIRFWIVYKYNNHYIHNFQLIYVKNNAIFERKEAHHPTCYIHPTSIVLV